MGETPRPARQVATVAGPAVLALLGACGSTPRTGGPGTEASIGQAQRYVQKAIRSSTEGVIVMPSVRAQRYYDNARLSEIAQKLRRPAAACFIGRAIETIKRVKVDGDWTYAQVPEGQAKIRARVGPDGVTMRAELLETGFQDREVEACIIDLIARTKWPENRSGNVHWIDVIYWVSLGAQVENDETRLALRRNQAIAASRAKRCLTGRVGPGRHAVQGLNLVDREGSTVAHRVEPSTLPTDVAACVGEAMSQVKVAQQAGTFVRPVHLEFGFEVGGDGAIKASDEQWLALVLTEERAMRALKEAELAGDRGEPPEAPGDDRPTTLPTAMPAATEATASEADSAAGAGEPAGPGADRPPAAAPAHAKDPGQGGHKLDLGRRGPRG